MIWNKVVGATAWRAALCGCTIFTAAAVAAPAMAQADNEGSTLSEIVVTAQKREQNLQDVPISVTALSADTLRANRVAAVMDLSAVAPNLIVHVTAGGTAIPAFEMRGVVSYGVAPGSDKEISIYIDGVYLGATRGSSFDLPDVERIEVLRGPQGTLFGRNSTAGAISVVTRDPSGKFGIRQELTYGNYDQFRSKTRIDLPQWGPLSATVSYVHDERRGDIKNLGAGQVWDRSTGPESKYGKLTSPKYLGGKNAEIWFAAVKFQPIDNFSMTYKFDHTKSRYTPEGVAAIAVNPAMLGPAGALLTTLLATQPTPPLIQNSAERPKSVNNNWVTPGFTKVYGHNLTTQWQINDKLSVKNILAYRYTYNFATYQLSGLGGLVNTVAALGPIGAPFVPLDIQYETLAKQWSDEVQVNYDSKWVTLTAGAVYFHENARSGGPPGYPTSYTLRAMPGGVVPLGTASLPYNYQRSKAAYVQAEIHVTSQIDLIGGYRINKDNKNGIFYYGGPPIVFSYNKTKPAYMTSINYKPNDDMMVYGKYSFGFVSGGAVGSVTWVPETAKSWEAGLKSDWLDRRLRTNLALFDVKYRNVQSAQGGNNVGRPELGTLIISSGDNHAKGFEFEATALPMRGLTLGTGVGYTKVKYSKAPAVLLANGFGEYLPTLRPDWTVQLRGEYETEPLFGEANVRFRIDANWRSKFRVDSSTKRPAASTSPVLQFSPASWIINGRIALQHLKVAGTDGEIAVWGKNLNNNKAIGFADITANIFASTAYQQARTFGVDLTLDY